jgi:hypothetical protein
MAVTESTKIIPYVTGSRKTVKLYLKVSCACFPFTRLSLILGSGMPGLVVHSGRQRTNRYNSGHT